MKLTQASAIVACLAATSGTALAQSAAPTGAKAAALQPTASQGYSQPYPQPQGYSQQQAYPQQQGVSQQQGYPQQPQAAPQQQPGYPQKDPLPQQGYPQQGYPQQGYPQSQGAATKQKTFIPQQDPSYGPPPLYPVQGFGTPGAAPPGQGAETAAGEAKEDLGHHGQVHFRSEFVTGYRMLMRYGNSPRCARFDPAKSADDQQKLCGYGAAPALGIALGFALVDYFEPFVFARLGLANEAVETNQGKLMQVGVGARLYTMASSRVKIFFAPWIGVDTTTGPLEPIGSGPIGSPGDDDGKTKVKPGAYKTDILAHFSFGPQVEITRGLGVYMSGGLTLQAARYFGASADLAFGLQARTP